MNWARRLWRKLTRRTIWVELDQTRTQAWIGKFDQILKRGYYYKVEVYRPEWGEWREIVVFPEQIKDSTGKVIALRVTQEMMGFPKSEPFYIDQEYLGSGSAPSESPTPRA